MAYLARIDRHQATVVHSMSDGTRAVIEPNLSDPEFSDLEWSIIRLARLDGLWTLRAPTRLSRFLRKLLGRNPNPALANPKLEILRRMAVLSWHFGFTVPGEDVAEFLEAGFTTEQYELLVSSIRKAATKIVAFPKAGLA